MASFALIIHTLIKETTGDFNAITSNAEGTSSSNVGMVRNGDFTHWIFDEALVDLGYSGQNFTWKRGREEGTFRGARLDRALCSMEWIDRNRNTTVTHLTAVESDHCPILIDIDLKTKTGGDVFMFQGAWTTHPLFLDYVNKHWNAEETVWSNKNSMAIKLKEWNQNVFGNIHHRKNKLLRRLDGQAREEWIASGDRNTKFYHAATKIKKASTRRHTLTDANGNPLTDEVLIENVIQDYFTKIFTREDEVDLSCTPHGCFPVLREEVWTCFNAAVSLEETRVALFDMSPLKAPGPDGFHAKFYQKAWQVVGGSVFKQVEQFMMSGNIEEGINDTFIALIPKTNSPTSASQYRPISLCNVIYKIITKVMTNRIKPILRRLIGHEQSSFVPGRQITDNILIYQEAVHSMLNRQGKKGLMILKIDLEKAYDRLNWDFIRDTLSDVGMSTEWIRNIMACVESPRLKVLWNGKQLDQIIPTRGIRQGDAISPYLFVMCMEKLSHIIKDEANRGNWKGVRLSRYGPLLTHLFFADDLVLFAEAPQEQIHVISYCLDRFSQASGQKVSLSKSQIFFSNNVDREEGQRIVSIAGIPETKDLGRYLGVPTLHGRLTNNLLAPMLEKIDERLNGWKTNFLSLAGRQILAQSVLQAIPYYNMQTIYMPARIWEEIDKRIRRFLWGGTPEARKCHLVCWADVIKAKNEGGLGLRSAKEMNIAFMAKLGWQIATNSDSLWVQVLKEKYAHGKMGFEAISPKRACSNAWRGILAALPVLRQGSRFQVNNGRTTKFWTDSWVHDKPLAEVIQSHTTIVDGEHRVIDYWSDERGWEWDAMPPLPESTKQRMQLITVNDNNGEDESFWTGEPTGKISVSSVYSLLHGYSINMQGRVWSTLWKMKVPNKMKTFLWTALHDRVMGNAERKRRRLTNDDSCGICIGEMESADHILRNCKNANDIWVAFVPRRERTRWRQMSFKDWIGANITGNGIGYGDQEWPRLFMVIIWWLWRWRCDRVFTGREVMSHYKVAWIKETVEEIARAFDRSSLARGVRILQLRWGASQDHRFTLNVDGSVKTGSNKAGVGGVIRNKMGVWVEGLAGATDYAEASIVEARAILECLRWAWQRGIRDIEVQSDAKNVILWIRKNSAIRGPLGHIISEVRGWLNRDWTVALRVIYREQNRVADRLASLGACQLGGRRFLEVCPIFGEEAYLDDLVHVTWARRVVEHTSC
ncbi:uncharacterized protein LOC116006838 [Ipomoea triloba]|uniref:uncharacterized protein LOC116006838 n=1 Tax=Ipomoea triloba TaxID=35885 RepID=UPI00125DCB2D|nr:uncharacterized protein LOC116006838 [Ipomoea triloba]